MIIHWRLPALLAADAGGRRTIDQELPGERTTLGEALHLLGRTYPKLIERITDDRGEVREHVNVFVRGELIRQGLGLRTPLEPGDEVVVLHAVSGGSPSDAQESLAHLPKHTQPHPELYNLPFTIDDFHGMPYRPLGPSGLWVSRVGLGTWKFGFPETGDGARVGPQEAFRIFDRAVELGVTFWDTANRYNGASGNSERLIGQWLKSNPDQRRNVVIATKVYGAMDGRTPNHCRASRANILDSVYACLQRLQTDYIDLLYFHRFDPITPVEESLAAVDDLVRRDLVRYFAVSNFTIDQLRLYRAAEAEVGVRCRVLAVQNQFDIVHGEAAPYAGVLDYCAQTGLSFVAHGPLATGLLTDRYLDPGKAGPGDRLFDEGTLARLATEEVLRKVRRLGALAREWDLSLSQLILAYMLTLPGMGPVIPGASTVQQLEANARAGTVSLTGEQKMQMADVLREG